MGSWSPSDIGKIEGNYFYFIRLHFFDPGYSNGEQILDIEKVENLVPNNFLTIKMHFEKSLWQKIYF